MNNIFSYYTKYRDHIDEYKQWNEDANKIPKNHQASNCSISQTSLKQKAKAIKFKNKRIIATAEQKVNYFLKFDAWC